MGVFRSSDFLRETKATQEGKKNILQENNKNNYYPYYDYYSNQTVMGERAAVKCACAETLGPYASFELQQQQQRHTRARAGGLLGLYNSGFSAQPPR